jgi:hypothetical protein
MAYYDQALLAQDWDFTQRVASSAAIEIDLGDTQPLAWAAEHIWIIAAAPGFADAYSSAIAGGVENPGRDPAVISDGQILAAVQAIPPDNPGASAA